MLVWWFFILGVGAIGFTIKILLDHIKDANQISDQITTTQGQIVVFEEKLTAEESEANEIKQELEQLTLEVETKNSTFATLQKQITQRKSVRAKQGKFKVE